jgi:hypothetical protein
MAVTVQFPLALDTQGAARLGAHEQYADVKDAVIGEIGKRAESWSAATGWYP